jgi:hypothetical protein
MTIGAFLSRLQKVKKTGPGRWMACCPSHNDKHPSLAVKDDNGVIVFHCFGCGAGGIEICNALGLEPSELFPPSDNVNYNQVKRRVNFPPGQILKALQYETLIVYFIAKEMHTSGNITKLERERLLKAVSRIQSATEYQKNEL